MTDTTDIKALRDSAALIAHGYKQRWGCETNEDTGFVGIGTFDHDGELCPFIEVSVSNWSDDDGDDERLAEFLTLANPVAILALLDQLEAERQRADDAERANRQQYRDLVAGQEAQKQLEAEIAALKASLANPVVLRDCSFEAVSHMAHWYSEGECVAWVSGAEHVKKQILEAGFNVKGE
jgi:hypothetical protein